MTINLQPLKALLLTNVVEIRFVSKRPKPGHPGTRRMLCTNSYELLNSIEGKTTLNYRPPKKGRQINEQKNNVAITWDIIMQDYRAINVDQCDLLTTVDVDNFWDYFKENVMILSAENKIAFMNT